VAAAARNDADRHNDTVAVCDPSVEVTHSRRNRILLFTPAADRAFAVAAQRTI